MASSSSKCVLYKYAKRPGLVFSYLGSIPAPPMQSSMIVLDLEEQSYSILPTGRGYEIWTARWLEGKIPWETAKGMRGLWEVKVIWKKSGLPGCPTCDYLICSLSKMSMYHVFVCLESFRRSFLLAPSSDFIVDSWRCNGGPGCLSAFGGAGGGEKAATSLAKCLVGREEFLWP